MKNVTMSLTLCLIAFLFATDLSAQNYWKGGTPGNETNWNTARNWSQNRVPDWSQNVIIPDVTAQSGFFPVISDIIEAIPFIEIQSNAVVTVLPTGRLVIDGETTYNSGIFLNGKLISNGEVDIVNVALKEIDQQGGELILQNTALAGH